MYNWPSTNWFTAGLEAWELGIEASAVIGMRAVKVASGGPDVAREMQLMIAEKVHSAFELQSAFVTGGMGTSPAIATRKMVQHYRRKVSANRRRLG